MDGAVKAGFAGKVVLGLLVLGIAISLVEGWVTRRLAQETLDQTIRPLRLDNAELRPALQELADSATRPVHLSMCPDLSSIRVTLTTQSEMPLGQLLPLLASRAGADVDLAHPRHGSFAAPSPHLFFRRAPCATRSFVYVYTRPR
jgi:hypothetical protein